MAKYDDIYPNTPKGFVTNRHDKMPPVVKFDYTEAGDRDAPPICSCGANSDWVNTTAMKFVCSTECNKKIWDSLVTTFVAEQISGAF